MDLIEGLLGGERKALARIITIVENNLPPAGEILRQLHFHLRDQTHIIGITGPPGAGKSTLTNALCKVFRSEGRTVGVITIDPSSQLSGGAVLGDRIRFQEQGDDGLFIRSLASHGASGGISPETVPVVKVLEAYGFDIILIETVGTGQTETDIRKMAHSVVVVSVPGLGDQIQAIKAGILEIGDIFAVNKADLDGAQRTAADLEQALELRGRPTGWRPPVIKIVALTEVGVAELYQSLNGHYRFLKTNGKLGEYQQQRTIAEIKDMVHRIPKESLEFFMDNHQGLSDLIYEVMNQHIDPSTAADEIWHRFQKENAKKL